MTITLTPETEAKLREKAERDGQDPNVIANDALSAFLKGNAPEIGETPDFSEETFVSTLPPEQPGEDPRMAVLREIEERSRFMKTRPSQHDYLREGRSGGMFARHTKE